VHPTFLYESLWNLLGIILLHFWSKKHRKFDGQLFLMYLCWYGFGRFFVEGLRTDSLYFFNTGLRVSQLVAVITFVASAILMIIINKSKNKKELYVNKTAEQPSENDNND
jgi:phosphatidylglycerol:prolipoprotein diacylglycerol transferase